MQLARRRLPPGKIATSISAGIAGESVPTTEVPDIWKKAVNLGMAIPEGMSAAACRTAGICCGCFRSVVRFGLLAKCAAPLGGRAIPPMHLCAAQNIL
jgi:hypothetical protein